MALRSCLMRGSLLADEYAPFVQSIERTTILELSKELRHSGQVHPGQHYSDSVRERILREATHIRSVHTYNSTHSSLPSYPALRGITHACAGAYHPEVLRATWTWSCVATEVWTPSFSVIVLSEIPRVFFQTTFVCHMAPFFPFDAITENFQLSIALETRANRWIDVLGVTRSSRRW